MKENQIENPKENKAECRDIILISNSPGELFSWVRVTAQKLKEKAPDVRIVVMLVPCPYATGKESEVAGKYPSVDLVFTPSDFLGFLFLGKTPDSYKPASKGVVVFLGGDFWHAAVVAWKLKYPAVAYATRPAPIWNNHFKYYFCPDGGAKENLIKTGVPEEKVMVVGNLVVEGVKPSISREEGFKKWNLDAGQITLGILPGSRLYHMQDSLPVFLKVADEIHQKNPHIQFLMGLSPFLKLDEIRECVSNPKSPITGSKGRLTNSGAGMKIETEGGSLVHILESEQYDLMNMSDLVLTIPGTNTAECAFLGKPMVVAFSWKARIPRGGLGFFLGALPMGKLRKNLYGELLKKIKFTALPNLIAGKKVVPEVMVENSASEITPVLMDLIDNESERNRMSQELKNIMGKEGAAEIISEIILNLINREKGGVTQ